MTRSQLFVCLIHFCVVGYILGEDTTLVISLAQCMTQNDCPESLTCVDMKCADPCPGACAHNSSCQVHKHVPFCACPPGFFGDPFTGCNRQLLQTQCLENDDCPSDRTCVKQKCEDPCYDVCNGNNTSCQVRNHIPYCTCKPGFFGDPLTACIQQYTSGSWPPYTGAKKRYEVETLQANWYGAMVHCMNHGGRLATIMSSEENEMVKEKINKSGLKSDFWVSGMNLALGNTWIWMSTGRTFTFTDWTSGQPDNHGEEHCLELWETGNYRWNDRNCFHAKYSICEYYD